MSEREKFDKILEQALKAKEPGIEEKLAKIEEMTKIEPETPQLLVKQQRLMQQFQQSQGGS